MKFEDLTGQKFGRLEVKKFAEVKGTNSYWNCLCDCGNPVKVYGSSLKRGHTRSCGCLRKERMTKLNNTHGQSKVGFTTSIYTCWQHMIQRCYNPNNKGYKNYGGRGIKVCERWHKFENFFADMGDMPNGMFLDRKDNNGDYTPENCRWATRKEQQNNTRRNVWKDLNGEKRTLTQWAEHLGINVNTLRSRLKQLNWSIERLFTTPVRSRI
jgi:hypothetical protein